VTGIPWVDEHIGRERRPAGDRHPTATFDEVVERAAAGDWPWFERTGVQVTHPVIWQGIADLARRVRALETYVDGRRP